MQYLNGVKVGLTGRGQDHEGESLQRTGAESD
jgi:hypothetical protein